MHPSFEAREGVSDRIFSSVSPAYSKRLEQAWVHAIQSSDEAMSSEVAHLHHLTPVNRAVERALPNVPVVTHLHGTELKFLAALESGAIHNKDREFGEWWARELREISKRSSHTICISPHDQELAIELLGLDSSSTTVIPNGVDVGRFSPNNDISDHARLAAWRRWLLDEPLGWDETGVPGSVACTADEFDKWFTPGSSVLMFVGRFLGFKRVPLLVRAYAYARDNLGVRAPLVIWGGAPGEWEGDHPVTVAREVGSDGIFFAGWRGHDELPAALSLCDVFVAPSVNEPFGQVYLEAMACGKPVIGTATGGPLSFVNVVTDQPDGWLVAPDDQDELAQVLADSVGDSKELAIRGAYARKHVEDSYSWDGLASTFAGIYDGVSA
jgi:glycosyltransferase involved in cell wall biosynthesis